MAWQFQPITHRSRKVRLVEEARVESSTVATATPPIQEVGTKPAETPAMDTQVLQRVPYRAYVALLLISPTGDRGRPTVLRARNLSMHGISVVSRYMIYPGSVGAIQLLRSDGRMALVGVQVKASRYMGNMEHHTGMSFMPLPHGVTAEEFLDKNGRLMVMDPLLRENLDDELRAEE